jgi:lipoprotein-anchoring transpeptidase ErfK/SrfK
MDVTNSSRRRSRGRARDRQAARQERTNSAMAVPRGANEALPDRTPEPVPTRATQVSQQIGQIGQQLNGLAPVGRAIQVWLRDGLWYLTHRPQFGRLAMIFGIVAFLFFVGSYLARGQIFPNIWVLGVNVGGMTVEEAQLAIAEYWAKDVQIDLLVEGESRLQVAPSQLGLQIDAFTAANQAKNIGMVGIPFGYGIEPTYSVDYQTAQGFLVQRSREINVMPFNAGYEMQNGSVVGIAGKDGRQVEIVETLDNLETDPAGVVYNRRLNIMTSPVEPDYSDPAPYLADVQQLVEQEFAVVGYDPVTDQSIGWGTTPDEFLSWIEVGSGGLSVREQSVRNFVDALNEQVKATDPSLYISADEAAMMIDDSLASLNPKIVLRFNHLPQTYTVEAGDGGYRIGRYTGLPFNLIQEVNPTIKWEELSVGQVINLPSVDKTLPLPPISNKRIVVNLDDQYLVLFENQQEVSRWSISSGMEEYPTYPGVYQILSHEEIAYGSSYTLCSEGNSSCGEWKMYYFMGMYEVSQDLMNGFHGAVELPNGAYLGGNNVGQPYTFGCVMSQNDKAEFLYNWAPDGTMVEVISSEYDPRSELGWKVWNENHSGQTAAIENPLQQALLPVIAG